MWIKGEAEWFYKVYSSPFRLHWAAYRDEPRSIQIMTVPDGARGAVATTAYEVQSVIVQGMRQYDVKEVAIDDLIAAAADYFSRVFDPDGSTAIKRWMSHSNVFGS